MILRPQRQYIFCFGYKSWRWRSDAQRGWLVGADRYEYYCVRLRLQGVWCDWQWQMTSRQRPRPRYHPINRNSSHQIEVHHNCFCQTKSLGSLSKYRPCQYSSRKYHHLLPLSHNGNWSLTDWAIKMVALILTSQSHSSQLPSASGSPSPRKIPPPARQSPFSTASFASLVTSAWALRMLNISYFRLSFSRFYMYWHFHLLHQPRNPGLLWCLRSEASREQDSARIRYRASTGSTVKSRDPLSAIFIVFIHLTFDLHNYYAATF